MEIITYDNHIIQQMVQKLGKDFTYVNFPAYLDAYIINTLPSATSAGALDADYRKFYAYYFKNNNDQQREQLFKDKLNELRKR